ncbi:MAG: HAMP domain-containing sensor histidine kinase [Rickettsiales bacterium]
MFVHFRIFAIISLIIVIGFTGAAGIMFRNVAIDDVKRLIDRNNGSIAEGYIESVWKMRRDVVALIKNNISEEDRKNPEKMKLIQNFAQDTVRYFKKMPLLRVNIYNAAGSLLITSNINYSDSLVGTEVSPDSSFIKKQFRGSSMSSQTIEQVKLHNSGEGVVLQALVPIISDEDKSVLGTSEGMVELVADLTTPLENLKNVQVIGTIYIVGFFTVYIGILYFMARRSESIITKQHEANIELSAAAAMAQSENRDKSQFLANISHELRTPLNSIIGFSEIIKGNMAAEGMDIRKFDGYVSDIHSSGVHLLSLINDILDYSKSEAGKLELEVAEVNLNKLVHNCIRLITPRAEAAQVLLVEALPKEILNIVTDSKKFKQILLNLLSNAVKFTPAGGEVRLTAWADIGSDSYMFEVRDTGIGIAPKDISVAMSPFGQVDSAMSRKYEGTGLGLPLSKKLVELIGGKFEISSEVGVGTTIKFSVPREIKPGSQLSVKNAG